MPCFHHRRIFRKGAVFIASMLAFKALLDLKVPATIINSIPTVSISENKVFVPTDSQEETFVEYHPDKTGRVEAIKEYSINTTQFAANCNPDDLFEVKHSKLLNMSVAVPLAKKAACPRVLPSGVSGLPLTGLLSFPGAGSTWTRHILQELTGIPTGSIYGDSSLLSNGFPSEGEVRNVIAVKSHVIDRNQPKFIPVKKFDRIIIVLRNVYDSFLAEYKRQRLTGSHTANKYVNTSHPTWNHFMKDAGYRWKQFMLDSFDFDGPMLVVFYEDLKTQLLPQITRLAEFLKSEKLKEFSFCCVVTKREGQFHRHSNSQKTEDLFSRSQKDDVNRKIRYVAKKLMGKHEEVAERLNSFTIP